MAKEKESKSTGLGLPQTKGTFQLKGVVTGTERDNFYKETLTRTAQKPWRTVTFGVKVDPESTVYVTISDGERDSVYFSKNETVDGKKKTVVEKVAWADRFKFNKEGFRLIGVNCGVKKITDDKGNLVNDKKVLTAYDACQEIADNLVDDVSVFVRGNIEYSHFEGQNGTIRTIKFVPNQVSLCKDVNFEEEGYKPVADFTQYIVFTNIQPEDESKKRFVVSAKIVNYNSVEDAEFIIENIALANTFRKNLKPYTGIKVWGNIKVSKDTEVVETTDVWGETNEMEKINTPTKRELIITGADPSSVDTKTYTEEAIEEALAKILVDKRAENEFGGVSDDWGSVDGGNATEEDDEAW